MSASIIRLFLAIVLLMTASSAHAQDPSVRATAFITNIAQGKPAEAYAMTDTSFQQKADAEKLSAIWKQMEQKFGKWHGAKVAKTERQGALNAVIITNDFDQATIDLRVVLNPADKIVGFSIAGVAEHVAKASSVPPGVQEEAWTVHTGEGDLQGTLTIPEHRDTMPVALIIAGSGPTDRNGNNSLGVTARPYSLLAQALALDGIASLRYDKRFIGASMDFQTSPDHATLNDFTKDAIACLELLKKDKRFRSVFIIGHSEGSLIGILAAQQVGVDGLVSLSGAGERLDKILLTQIHTMNAANEEAAKQIIDSLKSGSAMPPVPDQLKMLFNSSTETFLRSSFSYDPVKELASVKVPVLVISGSTDLQVSETDGKLLAAARPGITYSRIEGMNHILKLAPKDIPGNLKTYTDPNLPVVAELVKRLATFISRP